MKKLYPLIFFFFAFQLNAQITSGLLVKNKWGPEDKKYGLFLTFKNNGTYEYSFSGEGGINNVKGNFILDGKTLTLVPTSGDLDSVFSELKIKQVFTYFVDSNSFHTSECFTNEKTGFSFYNQNSGPIICDKIVNGITLNFINNLQAIVNTNAYVRNGPSKSFSYYTFYFKDFDKELSFLSAGYNVIILGETKNEESIGDLKGRWLYCCLNLGWYDSAKLFNDKSKSYGSELCGWIFSPLIKYLK
jgi:hypothetical protein